MRRIRRRRKLIKISLLSILIIGCFCVLFIKSPISVFKGFSLKERHEGTEMIDIHVGPYNDYVLLCLIDEDDYSDDFLYFDSFEGSPSCRYSYEFPHYYSDDPDDSIEEASISVQNNSNYVVLAYYWDCADLNLFGNLGTIHVDDENTEFYFSDLEDDSIGFGDCYYYEDVYFPIEVTKTWEDSGNVFNTRPSSVTFSVYGSEYDDVYEGEYGDGTCTASESTNWSCKILLKLRFNDDIYDHDYFYIFTSEDITEGYSCDGTIDGEKCVKEVGTPSEIRAYKDWVWSDYYDCWEGDSCSDDIINHVTFTNTYNSGGTGGETPNPDEESLILTYETTIHNWSSMNSLTGSISSFPDSITGVVRRYYLVDSLGNRQEISVSEEETEISFDGLFSAHNGEDVTFLEEVDFENARGTVLGWSTLDYNPVQITSDFGSSSDVYHYMFDEYLYSSPSISVYLENEVDEDGNIIGRPQVLKSRFSENGSKSYGVAHGDISLPSLCLRVSSSFKGNLVDTSGTLSISPFGEVSPSSDNPHYYGNYSVSTNHYNVLDLDSLVGFHSSLNEGSSSNVQYLSVPDYDSYTLTTSIDSYQEDFSGSLTEESEGVYCLYTNVEIRYGMNGAATGLFYNIFPFLMVFLFSILGFVYFLKVQRKKLEEEILL